MFLDMFMQPELVATWAEANFGVPTIGGGDMMQSPFFAQVNEVLGTQGLYMQQSPYYVESLDALAAAWQEMLLNPDIEALPRLQEVQDEILARYW